jgi:prepilin-type processing-associated H-X9-DG protein
MHRRGFTLIELFIVMGVIILLIAVLYPVLSSCNHPIAYQTYCQSRLRQLALGAMMYAEDYDKHFPPGGLSCSDPQQPSGSAGCYAGALVKDGKPYGYSETWQGGGIALLYPYTKDSQLFWCPRQEKIGCDGLDRKGYYAGFQWLVSPSRVAYPERKVMLMEAYSFHQEHPHRYDRAQPEDRFNIAFVDGHFKNMVLSTGCSGSADPQCAGWESCAGKGPNGNYICSGAGNGAKVPDFP